MPKRARRVAKNIIGAKPPPAAPPATPLGKKVRRPIHASTGSQAERLIRRAQTVRENRAKKQQASLLRRKEEARVEALAVNEEQLLKVETEAERVAKLAAMEAQTPAVELEDPMKKQLEAGLLAKTLVEAPVPIPDSTEWVGESTPTRTIKINVPTGIGDFSWVYSKLLALNIPMEVIVARGHPPRLVPLAELLPGVCSMVVGDVGYEVIDKLKVDAKTTKRQLLDWPEGEVIPISANRHLEQGNRIETWLPELPVSHHYPINIPQRHVDTAEALLPKEDFVCIFAANKNTCEAWDGWMAPQWCEFMQSFRKRVGDLPFVLIGASWDIGLGSEIAHGAERAGVPLLDLTGRTVLGVSFHIVKRSKYFIAFPSGMAIYGHVLNHPTTMFYPDCLQGMIGTFDSPTARATNSFHETPFCTPSVLMDWLVDVYDIKNKI